MLKLELVSMCKWCMPLWTLRGGLISEALIMKVIIWLGQKTVPVKLTLWKLQMKSKVTPSAYKFCLHCKAPLETILFRQLSEIQTYGLHKFFCKWLYVKHGAKAMVIIKHWQHQRVTTSMQDQILSSTALFAPWHRADWHQQETQCFGLWVCALSELLWNQQGTHTLLLNKNFKKCCSLAQLSLKWGFVVFAEEQ